MSIAIRRATASVWLAALAGCRATEQPVATEAFSSERADQILTGVTTNLAVDGRRKNYVVADSAFTYPEAQRLEFVRVRVTIFDDEGQHTATIAARRARYAMADRTLDALGDVVVITPRGDTLRSAQITFDNRSRKFRTDSAFVFKTKTGLVNGKGFTADAALRNLEPNRK